MAFARLRRRRDVATCDAWLARERAGTGLAAAHGWPPPAPSSGRVVFVTAVRHAGDNVAVVVDVLSTAACHSVARYRAQVGDLLLVVSSLRSLPAYVVAVRASPARRRVVAVAVVRFVVAVTVCAVVVGVRAMFAQTGG